MKRSMLLLTAVLAVGLARPARAEGQVVHADLNFAFTAGDVAMPAGHYVVREFANPDETILSFKNTDTGKRVLVEYVARIAPPLERSKKAGNVFVFDQIGRQHVLNQIRLAHSEGYLLPKSQAERSYERMVASRETPSAAQVG